MEKKFLRDTSRVLCICVCQIVALYAFASQPFNPDIVEPLNEQRRWKHFPELEGKGIRDIAETDDQTVWVSCNEGVLEYNGYDWKTHDAHNGLMASPVEQLLVADDNTIYATTPRGIFRYQNETWTQFFEVPENTSFTFNQIDQLSDGSIMACTDYGVFHFRDAGLRVYTAAPKIARIETAFPDADWIILPADALNAEGSFVEISNVLEEKSGNLWIAITVQMENGKLIRFHPSQVRDHRIHKYDFFESKGTLQLGEDQQLIQAQDNRIWVINSTSNKGISIYDGRNWEVIHLNQRYGGDEYMADIVQLEDGTIWISSMAKIYTFRNGDWSMLKAPHYPIPANRVILSNSQSDQLWVAGYKSRVLLFDYSDDQWLTYANIAFQTETQDGKQWFLEVNNKVILRDGDQWVSYGTEDGLMDAPIRVIETSKGQIWAAGSHRGVASTALLRNGKWERQLHPRLSWGIDYRSVFEAMDGSLWFGGSVDAEEKNGFYSGVLQLVDPTAEKLEWVHHEYRQNGLGQANVYGIGQTKDGRIWIGGSRLYYYDGISWKNPDDERLQQYVNVVCSANGMLLVGSRYYGIFLYDGKDWVNYNSSSGLPMNTVISIDALAPDCILVATENDICKFDGKSWTKDIFPAKLNMDFEGGSIQHTRDKTIWINHVPRSWKRRVYQNTREKIESTEFFTTRYTPTRSTPETKIGFYLESVSPEGNAVFSWTGKDFFAQTPAGQLAYSYRMDGGEWSEFSTETHHTFTSLPHGSHTLEVRSRDLDFNMDPTPAVVTFKVMPPIWKQGWFIALILTFLIIFAIYEYRVISKKKKLEALNASLQEANAALQEKGHEIAIQNAEILAQQKQIVEQTRILEINNKDLEERNTEIRHQRDQLEEMVEKVGNLSKAKLAFFTNISHELRTPLTLILGPAMQLLREQETLSKNEAGKLHSIIHRNAARLLKLINQLLEMRRIEHSTLELKLSEVSVPKYVSRIVELFHNLAIRREILLDFNNASDEAVASVDMDKVEKVLVNLLSNAFKHTPEGGSVFVSLDVVDAVDYRLNPFYEQYFEMCVEDTGEGISQEKLEMIFEKYYTSDSELIDTANTGIGLSYIKDLVYLMQGDIRVESQVGVGTKFRIYLPYMPVKDPHVIKTGLDQDNGFTVARQEASLLLSTYEEQQMNGYSEEEESDKEMQPTILVIEDHAEMRHFLEHILSRSYQVVSAENGKEGLRLAQSHTVDLIVSDVMMPEMDGLAFCDAVKSNLATSHIPVILLTAKALEEDRMSGYTRGADDFITKPFNPELLLVRIENLLQQRTHLREVFNKDFMLTPKTEKITSPDEEFLQRLVDIMNEGLSDADFNVDKMCKMVFLSHMHFIRKVKQLTGKKPVDLLKSFRMKKAKELLMQEKLSIAEVAYRVGFSLPNSFSRAFKKEFNITPTEFISRMHKSDEEDTKLPEEFFSVN